MKGGAYSLDARHKDASADGGTTFRTRTGMGSNAEASIHCAAWNPDPVREIAIRKDAVAARMILAELIGAEIPKPHPLSS